MSSSSGVSRLAPSPTGALHLGNARTFLVNWALARQKGWRLLMRMEDLDGPRIKTDAAERTLDILGWLGLDYDGDVLQQTDDLEPYREAMRLLAKKGLIFSCGLSRKEIEQAASAPHAGEHDIRFPPELRPRKPRKSRKSQKPRNPDEGGGETKWRFESEDTNYRFLVPDQVISVNDEVCGHSQHNPFEEVGDFVVWSKRGLPAYQLAVVVDDARQGITDVVRGDDLLRSAARQSLLYEALEVPPPRWWHLPLILGPDGHRLAKRHGDTRLDFYRDAGATPERIIGLLGFWCGVSSIRCSLALEEFLESFQIDTLPRVPMTMTKDDDRWLRDISS